MTVLLDTSVYSQPIRNTPLASVIVRWRRRLEAEYAVSAIVELEVLQGLCRNPSPRRTEKYQGLLKGRFPVLPFDAACAEIYARLQTEAAKIGQPRPAFDLMIASTALRNGLILATCNAKDFQGIDGLTVEDWLTHPDSVQ